MNTGKDNNRPPPVPDEYRREQINKSKKTQTKPSEATGGIYSKISNKTDLELYQTIFYLELSTKKEIQKAMLEYGYRTSDLTRSLQRLQSAGMIIFDDSRDHADDAVYSTSGFGVDNALSSLNSKNGDERYMAVDALDWVMQGNALYGDDALHGEATQLFDTVVNSLINRLNNDNNMDVILSAGIALFSYFIIVPATVRHPFLDTPLAPIDEVSAGSDMAEKYRGKILKALSDVSRKAIDIAIKCGAAKVTVGDDYNWWVSNLSVKWEKAQDDGEAWKYSSCDNPKIDVSKCPWEMNLVPGHKEQEKHKCAYMLMMIVDWRD